MLTGRVAEMVKGAAGMIAECVESGKEELPEIVFRSIRCLDPCLEDGSVGELFSRPTS